MGYGRFFTSMAAGMIFLTAVVSAASNLSAGEQVLQNVDTLIRDNGCPGCNLQGADLNRMDLSGADLSGADLTGASFFLTDLSEANLSGADLRDAQFGGADLANANLSGADLRDAVLDGAYLEGSMMDGIIIEKNSDPEEVDAALAELVHVPDQAEPKEVMDQKKVPFEEQADDSISTDQETPPVKSVTPIQQISIGEDGQKKNDQTVVDDSGDKTGEATRSQDMQENGSEVEADLSGENEVFPAEAEKVAVAPVESEAVEPEADEQPPVEKETFVEVVAENSQDSTPAVAVASAEAAAVIEAVEVDPQMEVLVEKLLDQKRCYSCNLEGVDLQRKNLRKSDLERSVLDGANLEGADLEMANLKGVSFRGANLRNADLRKTDLYKADFSGADMTGADLGEALLDETVFTDAFGYQPPLITQ